MGHLSFLSEMAGRQESWSRDWTEESWKTSLPWNPSQNTRSTTRNKRSGEEGLRRLQAYGVYQVNSVISGCLGREYHLNTTALILPHNRRKSHESLFLHLPPCQGWSLLVRDWWELLEIRLHTCIFPVLSFQFPLGFFCLMKDKVIGIRITIQNISIRFQTRPLKARDPQARLACIPGRSCCVLTG